MFRLPVYFYCFLEDAMVIINGAKKQARLFEHQTWSQFLAILPAPDTQGFRTQQNTAGPWRRGFDGNMPGSEAQAIKPSEVIASIFLIVIHGARMEV